MENDKEIVTIDKDMALGKIFAESGIFPDIKKAAQGYIKILAGKELGLSPIQALNSFYFVSGRLGIMAQAMAALVKKSSRYDYKIEKHTAEECSLIFYNIKEDQKTEIGQSTFTIKDAAKAGIVNKDVWKNYPMNMLFARALMNGVRWHCPDAVSAFVYSVEELSDLEISPVIEEVTMSPEGEVSNGKA